MIDTSRNLILINGEIRTSQIEFCRYNSSTRKTEVQFKHSDKVYSYAYHNIEWLQNPKLVDTQKFIVSHEGIPINNTTAILVFKAHSESYIHIIFQNGSEKDYLSSELTVQRSCIANLKSKSLFDYFKAVAQTNSLEDEDGIPLLSKKYEQINFIDERSAAHRYLNPESGMPNHYHHSDVIYPFGCNASQKQAVEQALDNQISIIQGPPGTGKTQTILNIIANLVKNKKSVIVVSNNNSATENVAEKLAKYNYDFIVAKLGNFDNKKSFCESQSATYPIEIQNWKHNDIEDAVLYREIKETTDTLTQLFEEQNKLAAAKQDYNALLVEQKHHVNEFGVPSDLVQLKRGLSSDQIISFWHELQLLEDQEARPHRSELKKKWYELLMRIRFFFRFRNGRSQFFQLSIHEQISSLQYFYYRKKIQELENQIHNLESFLDRNDLKKTLKKHKELSNIKLQKALYSRFGHKDTRPTFTEREIPYKTWSFLNEYPVVLSTTFSSRSNFNESTVFDYVIMDESSQVSSETGLLALSCAKNAVIVGDSLQLPNVLADEDKKELEAIATQMEIPEDYNCARYSFLESICRVIPNIPQTLLQEHYRCHPKIINFCNQKFYQGQLLIMTEDKGEKDIMKAIRTVIGNHSRRHSNQREVDVITQEVLPELEKDGYKHADIGIIAPYNEQVRKIHSAIAEDIEVATVHKFQGREKKAIIMTTVDDKIKAFSDDSHLLNVAISRAQEKFYLVASGNPQPAGCNIGNLLNYIDYNNFTITESKVHSIFDLLYKQYTQERIAFLERHKNISEYASENITYALLESILKGQPRFAHLGLVTHLSLNQLIKDYSLLDAEETRYVTNDWTHLDFLIYNRVSKQAVLAIETDGYMYHQEGTQQAHRDQLKNQVLEKYQLALLRLSTTGSNEKQRIEEMLDKVLS